MLSYPTNPNKKLKKLSTLCVLAVILSLSCTGQEKSEVTAPPLFYKFNFGSDISDNSYSTVNSNTIYNDSIGFGFDYNTSAKIINRKSKGIKSGFCTSSSPFYFSVKLPEGDYNITLLLGDIEGESLTTVKTESRRLMLEKIKTKKGEVEKQTFTVNVRTPRINDSVSIRLKSREYKYLNWDNKLTLEFSDLNPCVCAIEIEKIKPTKTIYLAGNSTVTDQYTEPWASWGQMITRFFEPGISIANYAESGEALSSFHSARRLEKILSFIQPGDYMFIEFAHNDQKRKGEGIGPWLSYSDYLRMYIDKARERGATPILVTSMHRRNFDESGKVINTLGDYPDAMRAVAKEKNVALIDLNNMSKELYEAWGVENSKKAFVHYPANTYPDQEKALADNTHFNNYGAYNLALCILYGITQNHLELTEFLKDFPKSFIPNKPIAFDKWDFPESPAASNEKPDGS